HHVAERDDERGEDRPARVAERPVRERRRQRGGEHADREAPPQRQHRDPGRHERDLDRDRPGPRAPRRALSRERWHHPSSVGTAGAGAIRRPADRRVRRATYARPDDGPRLPRGAYRRFRRAGDDAGEDVPHDGHVPSNGGPPTMTTTSTTGTTTGTLLAAPAARAEHATKIYGTGDAAVRALDDVTLDIPRGRLTAVMGPSGSGKSTLLHCMAGLDVVTSGRVLVDEQDLAELSDRELTVLRRTRIGFVFQAFNLVPTMTAIENVVLP